MRDSYYYKSLIATLFLYIAGLSVVLGFLLVTGLPGLFFLLFIIAVSFCYFYGMFDKSGNRVKGNNKV
jgi:hypothetical protein